MTSATDLGPKYEVLAHLMVEACGGATDGIFLYAELEPGVVAPALFQDVDDHVVYREPNSEIMDKLEEIWENLDAPDQWHVIECRIDEGRFDARFAFPDEIDPNESEDERQPRALKAVFGDKPILYPRR
jgi:hypothetical protein